MGRAGFRRIGHEAAGMAAARLLAGQAGDLRRAVDKFLSDVKAA